MVDWNAEIENTSNDTAIDWNAEISATTDWNAEVDGVSPVAAGQPQPSTMEWLSKVATGAAENLTGPIGPLVSLANAPKRIYDDVKAAKSAGDVARSIAYNTSPQLKNLADSSARFAVNAFDHNDSAVKYYEAVTGRPYLTVDQLADIPDIEKRNQVVNQQKMAIQNLGNDLYELPGQITGAAIAGGRGLANSAVEGYQAGGLPGAALNTGVDTAKVLGTMTVEGLKGIGDYVIDPNAQMQDTPLQAIGNASALAGVGAGLTASTKLGKLSAIAKELSPIPIVGPADVVKVARAATAPTKLIKAAVRSFVENNPEAATPVQWFIDSQAGVGDADLAAFESFQKGKSIRTQNALENVDDALYGLSKDDKKTMRDILAGESTRLVQPEWPSKLKYLRGDVNELLVKKVLTPDQVFDMAENAPRVLDNAVRLYKQKTYGLKGPALSDSIMQTAESLHTTLGYRDVKVLDMATNTDLGGLGYLLVSHRVDPANIRIVPMATSPFADFAMDNAKRLETIRRIYAEIGDDASRVHIGGGKMLLPKEVLSKHLPYYMPDYYGKGGGKGGDSIVEMMADIEKEGSQFAASKLKNNVAFADRIKFGAEKDVERAIRGSVVSSINDIEKYRLLEKLSNSALTQDAFNRLPQKRANLFVRVSDETVPGIGLPKFGALGGMYLPKPTMNLLNAINEISKDSTRAGTRILAGVERLGATWKTSKIVLNPPSWLNAIAGNLTHNLVDGGLFGSAKYSGRVGQALAKSAIEGLTRVKRKKPDPYLMAARTAGVLTDHNMYEIGDAMSLAAKIKNGGLFDGLSAYLNPANWKHLQAEDVLIRPYERAFKDNKIVEKFGKAFQAIDESSKLLVFERKIRQMAKARGVNPLRLLDDGNALKEAADHVDTVHLPYDDVPLFLKTMDRYTVLPFTRYAWKYTGAAFDLPAVNPTVYRAAVIGDRLGYEAGDDDAKERQQVQPTYAMERIRPLNDEFNMNARYLSPYSQPQELLAYKEPGDYGKEQYSLDGQDYGIGGPMADIGDKILLKGMDPMTGGSLADSGISRLGAAASAMLPGIWYHGSQKIYPAIDAAIEDKPFLDRRGREQDPLTALLHSMGVRIERDQTGKLFENITYGYDARQAELEKAREKAHEGAKDDEAHDKIDRRFDRLQELAHEQLTKRINNIK